MSKKFFALIGAALVLCLALVGCGEDDKTPESSRYTAPSLAGEGNSGTFGVDFGELFG